MALVAEGLLAVATSEALPWVERACAASAPEAARLEGAAGFGPHDALAAGAKRREDRPMAPLSSCPFAGLLAASIALVTLAPGEAHAEKDRLVVTGASVAGSLYAVQLSWVISSHLSDTKDPPSWLSYVPVVGPLRAAVRLGRLDCAGAKEGWCDVLQHAGSVVSSLVGAAQVSGLIVLGAGLVLPNDPAPPHGALSASTLRRTPLDAVVWSARW